MRILLQHARTLLYFKGLGAWTSSPVEALDFQHSQRAIDFARRHGLVGVQIAVKFSDCETDELVPLPPLEQFKQNCGHSFCMKCLKTNAKNLF